MLDEYTELVSAVLDCPAVMVVCYTQLTDTGQETNGLLTAERQSKRDPAAARAATRLPAAALSGDMARLFQDTRGVSPFESPSAEDHDQHIAR
jgi:hypothetical protein